MACKKCGNERVLGCPNCEQYDFSDKNAEIMSLLARAEAAEKRAEQAERDRDVLGSELLMCGYMLFKEPDPKGLDALSRCTPFASKEDKSC